VPESNGTIKNGDLLETHHIISKNDGGTDESSQLALMHKHCHDQYHALYLEQQHNKRKTDKNLALPYRIMSN
jgi:5-methylcytosine-specific restriction endonuclease McrA